MQTPWKFGPLTGSPADVQAAIIAQLSDIFPREVDSLWDLVDVAFNCSPVATVVTAEGLAQQVGDQWVVVQKATFNAPMNGGTIAPFNMSGAPSAVKVAIGDRKDIQSPLRHVGREGADEANLVGAKEMRLSITGVVNAAATSSGGGTTDCTGNYSFDYAG